MKLILPSRLSVERAAIVCGLLPLALAFGGFLPYQSSAELTAGLGVLMSTLLIIERCVVFWGKLQSQNTRRGGHRVRVCFAAAYAPICALIGFITFASARNSQGFAIAELVGAFLIVIAWKLL